MSQDQGELFGRPQPVTPPPPKKEKRPPLYERIGEYFKANKYRLVTFRGVAMEFPEANDDQLAKAIQRCLREKLIKPVPQAWGPIRYTATIFKTAGK